MRGFGLRVVEAAVDADLRQRGRRGGLARARAPRRRARSSARRSGRCAMRLGDQRVDGAAARPPAARARRRLDRLPAPSMPISRRRSAAAIRARVARLDRQHALRATAALRRTSTLVRRNQPLIEPRCAGRATCASMLSSDRVEHLLGLARGHERPEGARDLEPQVGARRGEILARRPRARRAPRARARRCGRRCRSATADRAACGSCRARRDRRPRRLTVGCGDRELVDVVGARVAGLRGDGRRARRPRRASTAASARLLRAPAARRADGCSPGRARSPRRASAAAAPPARAAVAAAAPAARATCSASVVDSHDVLSCTAGGRAGAVRAA